MKSNGLFHGAMGLLLITGLILAACGTPTPSAQTVPTKTPTTPAPTVTPKPTLTPTLQSMPPLEVGSVQVYHNEEGGFSLLLPAGWTVSPARQTPLGSTYELGPALLFEGRPGNSTLVVADAAQISVEMAVELLCDGECTQTELMEAVLGGTEAELAVMERPGQPALEWRFVEQGGKLIFFSIHHPDTLEPLDGVIQTFSFDSTPAGMAAMIAGVQVARNALSQELGVDPYTIVVFSADPIDFADACLGMPAEGEACAQVLTPGYIGYLQTRTLQYEFRADESGYNVRLKPGAALSARQILAQQLRVNLDEIVILSAERV